MIGPALLARFLEVPGPADRFGNKWQYHSRSDRHSKVGSWGVALDLLLTSSLMRKHAELGKIVIGVNHTMVDYATNRRKDLDLVIARPDPGQARQVGTFAGLAASYGAPLTDQERSSLAALPDIPVADTVQAVLVALEAKACMTAHVKSLPRLYDELNSSHLCVHGASSRALAIGYVQVNAATEFVSPVINARVPADGVFEVTKHKQPNDVERVLGKVAEMPRRSASSEVGFDGLGVTVLEFRNDGGAVNLITDPPAPQPGTVFNYESMIIRMANEYDTTFAQI